MSELRFSCAGLQVGPLNVPPFQVGMGEVVSLSLPRNLSTVYQRELAETLTGRRSAGIHVNGRIEWAEPATAPGGWLDSLLQGYWKQPHPLDWLCRNTGMSREAAVPIVGRLGLDSGWRLCQLAQNHRTLLGLEAAWARGADIVVFETVGCDPAGVRAVFALVSGRRERCAAIYLSQPFTTNNEWHWERFPDGACYEATWQTDRTALASTDERN